jgi:hypothetical protein
MKRLAIVPNGWPCTLLECPPGIFLYHDTVGFKSEYGCGPNAETIEVFVCESGEAFWGGTHTNEARHALIVQPCETKWEEYEI